MMENDDSRNHDSGNKNNVNHDSRNHDSGNKNSENHDSRNYDSGNKNSGNKNSGNNGNKNGKRSVMMAAVIAILLVICFALAACGKNENASDGKNTGDAGTAESAEATESAGTTEAAGSAESAESEESTGKVVTVDKNLKASDGEELHGVEDVAFFGVDTRERNLGKGTRSDSIMILHVNHDNKTVKILSVYRDTMVQIDGHGYEKITHAHSYGGPELAVSTINKNFDLDVSEYVTINFDSVGDLVDDIDGVEVSVDADEVKYINSYIDETNKVRGTDSSHIVQAGDYLMDGTQAVAYSRIRYTEGGDYKRAERQRTVLFAIFQKGKNLDYVTKAKIAEELMGEINSSFDDDEVLSLLANLSDYEIGETTAYPQVFYGGKVDGAWVEVPCTLVDMNTGIHSFLLDEDDYQPSETVQKISDELRGKVSKPNTDLTGDY